MRGNRILPETHRNGKQKPQGRGGSRFACGLTGDWGMNGFQWFAHYPREHLIEVGLKLHWTIEGPYHRIVDAIWMGGGKLVDNDSQLASIVRCTDSEWSDLRGKLSPFFEIKGGCWRHAHVTAELKKAHRLHEARSVGAQTANANRHAERALSAQSPPAVSAVRALSRQTDREEETDRERKGLDADASPVSSPSLRSVEETSPHAAQKVFLTRIKKLKVEKGAVFGQLRKVGWEKVDEALAAVEHTKPIEPTPFFVACCQDRVPIANGNGQPAPPSRDYAGPTEPMTEEMRERLRHRFRQYREETPDENPQTL